MSKVVRYSLGLALGAFLGFAYGIVIFYATEELKKEYKDGLYYDLEEKYGELYKNEKEKA